MDLENAENKLKKADSFLTTLTGLLKKHWKLILFLLFCWFIYWAFTLPIEDEREIYPGEEFYQEENYQEY